MKYEVPVLLIFDRVLASLTDNWQLLAAGNNSWKKHTQEILLIYLYLKGLDNREISVKVIREDFLSLSLSLYPWIGLPSRPI